MTELAHAANQILMPPASLLVLMLAGALLLRPAPRTGRTLIALGILLLYVLSTALVSSQFMKFLDRDQRPPILLSRTDPAHAHSAIVILSGDMRDAAPEYGGDTVGPLTLERLRYGAYLARRSGLPILVTGGKIDPHGPPIALLMRQVLETEFGVPVKWVETASRNTHENAVFSTRILKSAGIDRILLVTNAWHMPRAEIAFRGSGLKVVPAPTGYSRNRPGFLESLVPSPEELLRSAYALHEMIGNLWYRLAYR